MYFPLHLVNVNYNDVHVELMPSESGLVTSRGVTAHYHIRLQNDLAFKSSMNFTRLDAPSHI
jgi:hypothetical protein